jgi:hypothetical protein
MGQTPKARLLYGLRFDLKEIPDVIRNNEDDPDDIIDIVLGNAGDDVKYGDRVGKRGSFMSRYLGGSHHREALVLACFGVEVRSWGIKTFEMPSEEAVEANMHKLRAAAAAAGFPEIDTRAFAWYLEADFG